MKIYYSILGQKFELYSAAFILVGIIFFIALGNWQIKRMRFKNDFINNIERHVVNPAVLIADNPKEVELYSKIKVAGRFLQGRDILLYGRRSASTEKDGYYLLSAFKAENGSVYLVSKGWVPQSIKLAVKDFLPPPHEEIIGIAMPGEEERFFMPKNDIKNGVWFTLDLNMSSTVLGIDVTNFYLMQIASNALPSGVQPLSASNLNKVRNDHLEYAITWYIMALCLFIFYIYYSFRKKVE